jgi:hypothetical protein
MHLIGKLRANGSIQLFTWPQEGDKISILNQDGSFNKTALVKKRKCSLIPKLSGHSGSILLEQGSEEFDMDFYCNSYRSLLVGADCSLIQVSEEGESLRAEIADPSEWDMKCARDLIRKMLKCDEIAKIIREEICEINSR